jgi:hypothetical protein
MKKLLHFLLDFLLSYEIDKKKKDNLYLKVRKITWVLFDKLHPELLGEDKGI